MLNNCIKAKIVPQSWETSILKVIPKVPGEIPSFDSLRPLNLSNVDCKNEAGMLNKRMVTVTDEVIHKLQTGGLPHRQVQQSTFLIHLLINLYKENNWSGYIVALDNVKAFDKLKRDFMWVVLERMGFDPWTVQAIKNLYRETSVRLIMNGFLSEPFPIESGVKQGCPLSSLLFAIAMEPLARSILEDPLFKNLGFRLPGNKEIRLIQHLDDMTLFAHGAYAVSVFMAKVLKYNPLSGASINYKKSFVIRLDRQSQVLASDGNKICNITVLQHIECRKILGIYFGSDASIYVEKNWWSVHEKCINALKTWSICFSSNGFTSLIGRALVVHVMVHSKLIYLMQSMQFFSDAIVDLNKKVHMFLWAGKKHIPVIKLEVLQAPKKFGGIGIKPLMQTAISMRFNHIKNFFVRDGNNWIEGKSPVEAIIGYFLDLSVHKLVPNMPRATIAPLYLISKYHSAGSIQHIGHLPAIFDVLYWDVERALSIIGATENFEYYSHQTYLDDLMERRTLKLRQTTENKAYINFFLFNANVERCLWNNILLKSLDPKVQAFSFKLAHNCLPTRYNIWKITRNFANNQHEPWCQFCKLVMHVNTHCTIMHILMDCPIAKDTWVFINSRLETAGKSTFNINDERFILFRFPLNKYDCYFVTEILWALWRVNNYNNYDVPEDQIHRFWTCNNVITIATNRIKYSSKIDRAIYSELTYQKKWAKINSVLQFI